MSSLELLVSPPGRGKTYYCVDQFRNQILSSKSGIESRSFFILPSLEHAERIQNLVLREDVIGLFNAHILTINDFAEKIIGEQLFSQVPTDAIRRGILRQVLGINYGQNLPVKKFFPYFDEVRDCRGFHTLLLDAIKEFKSSLLTMKEFERRSQKLLKDPSFRSKYRDFCVVFKRYEKELKGLGMREPEEEILRLTHARNKMPQSDLIIFDGFYHFTPGQRRLIEYLSRRSKRIMVTLTLSERTEGRGFLFDYAESTRIFMKQIGFVEKTGMFQTNTCTASPALLHCQRNIFLDRPARMDLSKNKETLIILEGGHRRQEIEMIAREIKTLYKKQKLYFSDMCLILRRMAPYENIIESVFEEFEIPVHVHERKRIIGHGLGRIVFLFMELAFKEWPREELLEVLKSGLLDFFLPPGDVAAFENLAKKENVKLGKSEWEKLLALPEISAKLRACIQRLMDLGARLAQADSAVAFKETVFLFLKQHYKANPECRDTVEAADREVFGALMNIAQNAVTADSKKLNQCFNPALFALELQDALEAGLYSVNPPGKNRVQVYDIVMALPKEYKVVFMVGLLEGEFPSAVRQDALFKDYEREIINAKGIVLEERRRRINGEKYFFYMGVTRPRERLYLTYPLNDSDGKETLPSFFVDAVKRCFDNITTKKQGIDQLLPDYEHWSSRSEALQGVSSYLFGGRAGERDRKRGAYLFELVNEWVGADPIFDDILRVSYSKESAMIHDSRLLEILKNKKIIWSPTSLELFNNCPFKYFVSRTLGLEDTPANAESIAMGTLLHKTLEEFYGHLPVDTKTRENLWKNEPILFQQMTVCLDKAFSESVLKKLPPYRQRMNYQIMRRVLELFLVKEAEVLKERDFAPKYFETVFGPVKGDPAKDPFPFLTVENSPENIMIRGKIDRIDVSSDDRRALVIDYKSSKLDQPMGVKIEKRLEIQLPIYVLAATRLMKLDIVGAEYFYVRKNSREGFYRQDAAGELALGKKKSFSTEEWNQFFLGIENLVREIDGRVRRGDISVCPKQCKYCIYDSVCRYEKWKLIYDDENYDED